MAAVYAILAALIACTTLDKLNQESDELLDRVNNGGRSSSSSSGASSSTGKQSGLSVVNRPRMPHRTVTDANGDTVTIWGQSKSSSKTHGHDAAMDAEAFAMATSGDYEYVTIQRAWRTATGRVSPSSLIPDVIGVRRNGKVDAVEVRSRTDKERALRRRLRKGLRSLPPERRGKVRVIDPGP